MATAMVSPEALAAADYDLVIRGGRVIDPSQRLDRRADVAIRGGRIAAIRPDIPAAAATESIDARGRIVVPGLIDIHLHARDAALPPSDLLSTGVTTMVDAGSKGADNVDQIVAIARNAPNRLRVLLNIARLGNDPVNGEFTGGLEAGDVNKARRAAEANRDWVIGMKARLSKSVTGNRDLDVLKLALQVARPLNLPLMVHIGDTFTPLPQLLALLRPGAEFLPEVWGYAGRLVTGLTYFFVYLSVVLCVARGWPVVAEFLYSQNIDILKQPGKKH